MKNYITKNKYQFSRRKYTITRKLKCLFSSISLLAICTISTLSMISCSSKTITKIQKDKTNSTKTVNTNLLIANDLVQYYSTLTNSNIYNLVNFLRETVASKTNINNLQNYDSLLEKYIPSEINNYKIDSSDINFIITQKPTVINNKIVQYNFDFNISYNNNISSSSVDYNLNNDEPIIPFTNEDYSNIANLIAKYINLNASIQTSFVSYLSLIYGNTFPTNCTKTTDLSKSFLSSINNSFNFIFNQYYVYINALTNTQYGNDSSYIQNDVSISNIYYISKTNELYFNIECNKILSSIDVTINLSI